MGKDTSSSSPSPLPAPTTPVSLVGMDADPADVEKGRAVNAADVTVNQAVLTRPERKERTRTGPRSNKKGARKDKSSGCVRQGTDDEKEEEKDDDELFLMKVVAYRSSLSSIDISLEDLEETDSESEAEHTSHVGGSNHERTPPCQQREKGRNLLQVGSAASAPGAVSVPGIQHVGQEDEGDEETRLDLEEGLAGRQDDAASASSTSSSSWKRRDEHADQLHDLPIAAEVAHDDHEDDDDPWMSASTRLELQLAKADDQMLWKVLERRSGAAATVAVAKVDKEDAESKDGGKNEDFEKWIRRGGVIVLILIVSVFGFVILSSLT